jgi:hypothetical protein
MSASQLRTGGGIALSRLARPAALWGMLFAGAATVAVGASARVESTQDEKLSAAEISALNRGADGHPYATLALLSLLLGDTAVIGSGALYLESIPENSLTSLLMGSADRNAIMTLLGTLEWNPYSVSRCFVQVSWSALAVSADTEVLEFHTHIIIPASPFHHPPVESDLAVLLSRGTVSFLAPPAHM